MGIVLNWNSTYPGGGIDDTTINFPTMVDVVHNVMASHVNALAAAVIQLETAVGVNGGLTVREVDSNPSVTPVQTLVCPNGSVTNLGSNTAEITFSTNASGISFNNILSGILATNVQDALDTILTGSSTPPLNFTPVAADFDTPVVIGAGSVSIAVTDIVGGSDIYATTLPEDSINVEITDPDDATYVLVPIVMPSVLPDNFKLTFSGGPIDASPQDIKYGFVFTDVGLNNYLFLQFAANAIPVAYSPQISAGNLSPPTGSVYWELPSDTYSSGRESTLLVKSVQPFAVVSPQLVMELDINDFGNPASAVSIQKRFRGLMPTSGDPTIDLPGLTLKEPHLFFVFPTGFIGTVNFRFWIKLQRHPEDNI